MAKKIGPRGGKTTVTSTGMVRKALFLYEEEAEALRVLAFEERRPESELMREAIHGYLVERGQLGED
jgi:hypothetical protein